MARAHYVNCEILILTAEDAEDAEDTEGFWLILF
jgi:hypothetical protein